MVIKNFGTYAFVYSVLLTCLSAQAQEQALSIGHKYNIRDYCILPEKVGIVEAPRDISDCGIHQETFKAYRKELWLKRPGSKCCVAIVREELDGRITLNPKGYQYGPIPQLACMDRQTADELWKAESDKGITDQTATYELTCYGSSDVVVFLDTVFKDNKLEKYKVRSSQLPAMDWHSVH